MNLFDTLKRPLVGLVLTGAVLSGILFSMVWDRVQLLRGGREIVVRIVPVDPRDIFKGDYVRLGYEAPFSRPAKALFAEGGQFQGRVFATLEQAADEKWNVIAVARARPVKLSPNQIVLAATNRYGTLNYGLERYYVPEGTGRRLEDKARAGVMSAIVAVNAKGQSAIKGLIIDGQRVYEEPLL
jgi:uncharacterized membrane-anchored protein